eukprot:3212328-Rhodomonas_salina.1
MSSSAIHLQGAEDVTWAEWFLPTADDEQGLGGYVRRAARFSVRFQADELPPSGVVTVHHASDVLGFWGRESVRPGDPCSRVLKCDVADSRILRTIVLLCKRGKLLYSAVLSSSDAEAAAVKQIGSRVEFNVQFWLHLNAKLFHNSTGGQ